MKNILKFKISDLFPLRIYLYFSENIKYKNGITCLYRLKSLV